MATQIYLGYPPENIKKWIMENVVIEPTESPLTKIWFADEPDKCYEYDWEGSFTQCSQREGEIRGDENGYPGWFKQPLKIEIGTKITTIGENAFYECNQLTSILIPNTTNVINISDQGYAYQYTFYGCTALTDLPNSTVEQVALWFDQKIFGSGMYDKIMEFNLNCKNGVLHAIGKEDGNGMGGGWNVTCDGYIPNKYTIISENGNSADYYFEDEIGYREDCGIYEDQITEIIIGNNITKIGRYCFSSDGNEIIYPKLQKITIFNDTISIDESAFKGLPLNIAFPNSTVEQVKVWFESRIFGSGGNQSEGCAISRTVTCKNGVITAQGIWNSDIWDSTGWSIDIKPL